MRTGALGYAELNSAFGDEKQGPMCDAFIWYLAGTTVKVVKTVSKIFGSAGTP